MLSNLIEALQIFLKYDNPARPTWCEHDALHVCVEPAKVSADDVARLDALGFFPDDHGEGFTSFEYGSA